MMMMIIDVARESLYKKRYWGENEREIEEKKGAVF